MTTSSESDIPTTNKELRDWHKKVSDTWDKFSDHVEEHWDDLCDWLEEDDKPDAINWIAKNILRRLTIEAPVVIIFCFICVMIHILQKSILPGLNTFLAVRDTFDITSPMQIPRLFTHVIAHDGSMGHIKGNMVHLLLVGPSAEHVYGSQCILMVILLVALSSSLAHILLGSAYTHQLGASGVVFSVILLNSLVAAASGKIPVSFVLTAGLWCFDELWKFFFGRDGVSHHAHLTGAIVGTAVAFYVAGAKSNLDAKINVEEIKDRSTTPLRTASSPTKVTNWWSKKFQNIKNKSKES